MIERMRAPLDPEESVDLSHDDDDTSNDEGNEKNDAVPGTFPERSATNSHGGSYY